MSREFFAAVAARSCRLELKIYRKDGIDGSVSLFKSLMSQCSMELLRFDDQSKEWFLRRVVGGRWNSTDEELVLFWNENLPGISRGDIVFSADNPVLELPQRMDLSLTVAWNDSAIVPRKIDSWLRRKPRGLKVLLSSRVAAMDYWVFFAARESMGELFDSVADRVLVPSVDYLDAAVEMENRYRGRWFMKE